jgi:putative Holliday junction resolvase
MRTLGLDVGERRIGVAISDPEERLAVPLRVLERRGGDADARAIAELARREGVGRIVVGLPVSLNGTLGPQARQTQAFVERLRAATDAEVVLYDERLSTAEADRHLRQLGMREREMRSRRDAVAAAIILQAYLDSRRAAADS